ncbi:fumarylacetoacetate hydrolase family protein [Puia sp. P3]|uniref:fumarylacetoacetate hydrolase family protein n=1 Tax=Puia sp. P3 TaxID=3423952 RepID=UPI003D679C85
MKLLNFWENGLLCRGTLTPEGVVDESGALRKEEDLLIGPCVGTPSKIICIGLNYRQHAFESGMAIPAVPVVFTKYNNTLVGYGGDVSLGKVGSQFDYEVELGVVIGRKCKDVAASEALDYVLGYCVANDLSCRDLQFRTSQWLMGKSLDHFLPLGKYLVTADEVGDPQRLQLRCKLNGEVRQDSNTSDMIFSVAEIIEDLSKHMTLEPGDLILTGTPQGVIMGLAEKNWLRPGDVVEAGDRKVGGDQEQNDSMSDSLVAELEQHFPATRLKSKADRQACIFFRCKLLYPVPRAIVFPETVDEIKLLFRLAAGFGTSLTFRTGGTESFGPVGDGRHPGGCFEALAPCAGGRRRRPGSGCSPA